MKKYCHLLGIVLCVASLVLVMSSCDEEMTKQMDRVVDTGTEPPAATPDIPAMESDAQAPDPVPPLPEGTVVFVEPRHVTSPAVGQQLQLSINVEAAADVLAYEVRVDF